MSILTSHWASDAMIAILSLFFGVYLYLSRNKNHWKSLGVKQLPTSLIFGNTGDVVLAKKTPNTFLMDLYRKGEGEKFIGFYVFNRAYLMVRDPEQIKNVFVKDFSNFSNKLLGGNSFDKMGDANLFLTDNPLWRHVRTKVTPIFTSVKLKKMLDVMLETEKDFNKHMEAYNLDGKYII